MTTLHWNVEFCRRCIRYVKCVYKYVNNINIANDSTSSLNIHQFNIITYTINVVI